MALNQQNDVSRRALSVARMIDRLGPGKFNVLLIKPEGESDRWIVQIDQQVTLQKKELDAAPRIVDMNATNSADL